MSSEGRWWYKTRWLITVYNIDTSSKYVAIVSSLLSEFTSVVAGCCGWKLFSTHFLEKFLRYLILVSVVYDMQQPVNCPLQRGVNKYHSNTKYISFKWNSIYNVRISVVVVSMLFSMISWLWFYPESIIVDECFTDVIMWQVVITLTRTDVQCCTVQ